MGTWHVFLLLCDTFALTSLRLIDRAMYVIVINPISRAMYIVWRDVGLTDNQILRPINPSRQITDQADRSQSRSSSPTWIT